MGDEPFSSHVESWNFGATWKFPESEKIRKNMTFENFGGTQRFPENWKFWKNRTFENFGRSFGNLAAHS